MFCNCNANIEFLEYEIKQLKNALWAQGLSTSIEAVREKSPNLDQKINLILDYLKLEVAEMQQPKLPFYLKERSK